jgi:putative ABC transport system ATP-binding protein
MLSVVGVGKMFDDGDAPRWVVRNVTFDVESGEVVALWGPSGCGKSTLLNLVAGLLPVDEGEISVNVPEVPEIPEVPGAPDGGVMRIDRLNERRRVAYRRKNLGFIFQFYNLIPTLTVEENVRFPLELNGLPELADQALARLDTLGVADRAHAFPETLSGGEQQRVAIARAFAHAPPIVLADEPTGNLDADSARAVVDLLWREVRQAGTALVVATHNEEIAQAADRIVSLG